MYCGEIIKGHVGQYRTFSYPEGLRSSVETAILSDKLPGDKERCNLSIQSIEADGRLLLVSALSAAQSNSSVGAVYQHAAFFEQTSDSYWGDQLGAMVNYPFASEEDFKKVADNPEAFSADHLPFAAWLPTAKKPGIDPEKMAALACACLWNGRTNDFGKLIIQVPKSEDYITYYRSLVAAVYRCVPQGLQKHLSFSSNPDSAGTHKYVALFVPEGQTIDVSGKTLISLADGVPELQNSLRPEVRELVFALAKDPQIARMLFEQVERGESISTLTDKRYVVFNQRMQLRTEAPTFELLQKYNQLLSQSLTDREHAQVIDDIKERFPDQAALEAAIKQDPDLHADMGFSDIGNALAPYRCVLESLGKCLSDEYSKQLIQHYYPKEDTALQLLRAREKDLASGRKDDCFSRLSPSVLDGLANSIQDCIEKREAAVKQGILEAVRQLGVTEWDLTFLKRQLAPLEYCCGTVKNECLTAVAKQANLRLEQMEIDPRTKEADIEKFYNAIKLEVGDIAGMRLTEWMKGWRKRVSDRDSRLSRITDFPKLLSQESDEKDAIDHLARNFNKNKNYEDASLCNLLIAAEMQYKKAWCESKDKLKPIMEQLAEQKGLGILLKKDKPFEEILSELYACRSIVDHADICLWLEHAQLSQNERTIDIKYACETVETVYAVLKNGDSPSAHQKCHHRVIRALKEADLLNKKDAERLESLLKKESLEEFGIRPRGKHQQETAGNDHSILPWLLPVIGAVIAAIILFLIFIIKPGSDKSDSADSAVAPETTQITPQISTVNDNTGTSTGTDSTIIISPGSNDGAVNTDIVAPDATQDAGAKQQSTSPSTSGNSSASAGTDSTITISPGPANTGKVVPNAAQDAGAKQQSTSSSTSGNSSASVGTDSNSSNDGKPAPEPNGHAVGTDNSMPNEARNSGSVNEHQTRSTNAVATADDGISGSQRP